MATLEMQRIAIEGLDEKTGEPILGEPIGIFTVQVAGEPWRAASEAVCRCNAEGIIPELVRVWDVK